MYLSGRISDILTSDELQIKSSIPTDCVAIILRGTARDIAILGLNTLFDKFGCQGVFSDNTAPDLHRSSPRSVQQNVFLPDTANVMPSECDKPVDRHLTLRWTNPTVNSQRTDYNSRRKRNSQVPTADTPTSPITGLDVNCPITEENTGPSFPEYNLPNDRDKSVATISHDNKVISGRNTNNIGLNIHFESAQTVEKDVSRGDQTSGVDLEIKDFSQC
jgi:hypothetical protein